MKRIISVTVIIIIAITLVAPSAARALSPSQTGVFNNGIYFFNTDIGQPAALCGDNSSQSTADTGGGGGQPPTKIMISNSQLIMGLAKTENLGKQGALIALMVGLDESSLTSLANRGVPVSEKSPDKQGDAAGNYDSVGIMQQRVASGWSSLVLPASADIENSPTASQAYANSHPPAVFQIMQPAYAAEAFFGAPPGSNASRPFNTAGLQNVKGWQSMQPWVAAQAVQHSGTSDGSNYKQELPKAQSLLNQYWDSSSPVPLPIPFSGGNGGNNPANCTSDSNTTNGTCNITAPVYIPQYSQQQLTDIFGNPGTLADHSAMQNKQVTVNFLGNAVSVNPLVAPCLTAVASQIQQSGSTYKVRSMGCYRFDSDNGTSNIGLKSYHTYGAACDINPDTNPFVESGKPTAYDMPKEYINAFHDHGFTWGGSWTQPKDYMHFEFHGINPPG